MNDRLMTLLAVLVVGSAVTPAVALADFSACASAYAAKDPQRQIELYTSCLKRGGLMSTDVAGAFNNRGVAYEQIGETDQALQDFASAVQYDPSWPAFRLNLARLEARKGQCAKALADMTVVLKMGPHNKSYLETKNRMVAGCPVVSGPAN